MEYVQQLALSPVVNRLAIKHLEPNLNSLINYLFDTSYQSALFYTLRGTLGPQNQFSNIKAV